MSEPAMLICSSCDLESRIPVDVAHGNTQITCPECKACHSVDVYWTMDEDGIEMKLNVIRWWCRHGTVDFQACDYCEEEDDDGSVD